MEKNIIKIIGAKENNLKNVSLEIPRNKLVVFSGVSGSGKSTLAFDTIFAEGQRRYVESLSSYARQFLGQTQKPDVESIEGLSPSISIDQKSTNHNPRSTVGTVTEIYDYLRLLYSRIGVPYCPNCKKPIEKQSVDQIVDKIMLSCNDNKTLILAPVVRGQKGSHNKLLESLKRSGYVRVMIDGNMYLLEEELNLDKNIRHTLNVVVDRLVVNKENEGRIAESIETALKLAEGIVICQRGEEQHLFSTNYSCPNCGYSIGEITPRTFSFNSPFGACDVCSGLGYITDIDESKILKNQNLSINQGAFNFAGWIAEPGSVASLYFEALSKKYGINLNKPIKELPRKHLEIILYGNNEELDINGRKVTFEGISKNLSRRFKETKSEYIRYEIKKFFSEHMCHKCEGKRLSNEALSIKIDGKDISQFCSLSIDKLLDYLNNIKIKKADAEIAESVIREINARLKFLLDVGLNYLTLSRSAESLSGGESQRIRLATQIGSGLVGVLYILDEPSIGLHQRDNEKLLNALFKLRDLGNTLIVVEHDEDTIRSADYLVDIGPYAGVHGGQIVVAGSLQDVQNCKQSVTGMFLNGKLTIDMPKERRKPKDFLKIIGAKENNLKNINLDIPLGVLTAVTGVSGSGKSSLVNGVLFPYLSNILNRSRLELGKFDKIENVELLDKIILIDQSPIGRTPRSNPATYSGLFTHVRELFSATQDAKERGFKPGRFSFNVRGGRCEACEGAGIREIEMYFLSDIEVPCEVCKGKRYNRETLEVKYKGKNIYDVLDMTVEDALKFFENIPAIYSKVKALNDVGLGYIKLGQSGTTLSGGEAQRVKLASELARKGTGKTIYVLDEPTTGLHSYDVKKLIDILQKLVDNGNSVIVIEHNLDVIKCADYCIDLGPEGGDKGGDVIAQGTPEEISNNENSYTGMFLKKIFNSNNSNN
ncbi:MAG: excinuclease ABC subunit UvrA [Clostridia bacterium]|nr:excinuclease ABC subunit UvrA [Clostridia bacterium]